MPKTTHTDDLVIRIAAELFVQLYLTKGGLFNTEFIARQCIEAAEAFARVAAEREGT